MTDLQKLSFKSFISSWSPLLLFTETYWSLLAGLFAVAYWKRKRICVIYKTFPRDIKTIMRMSRLVSKTKSFQKDDTSVVQAFQRQLAKTPQRVVYYFEDQQWTLQDVEEYSNKIANIFYAKRYQKGDVVGIMMSNSPAYVCVWLGLSKLGVIAALLNTSIKGASLLHCINIAKCRAIIFSHEFSKEVVETCKGYELFQLNGDLLSDNAYPLMDWLPNAPVEFPSVVPTTYGDKALYIYTSGTTGLPKPAVLPHSRYLLATNAMMCLLNINEKDIIYNPLPLYHTAGGALGAGPAIIYGIPIVLRTKFSASSYIPDCIKYNCTVGQYIGEMCRYILAVPLKPDDTKHKLRLMIGNGLRPAIWQEFVERFKIPQITEVYGATEGNVNIANLDGKLGAVGSLPTFLPNFLFPVGIVKINPETEEPVRTPNGLCIRCKPGEPGMFVGLIKANDPTRQFHGYVNESDSKKKIWRDVFKKGDSVFVSGDLMVMDELGYIFFKDRTGDTFRWKGENVATCEVEAVISNIAGLKDSIVYGVKVGDLEGKAGMAAVVDPAGELDLSYLADCFDKALPTYARPLFLRVLQAMELTGTFKMKKTRLQSEGFDPEAVEDKLYFRQGPTYVPLTKNLYMSIIQGAVKI